MGSPELIIIGPLGVKSAAGVLQSCIEAVVKNHDIFNTDEIEFPDIVKYNTVSDDTVPDDTVPDDTVSDDTVPDGGSLKITDAAADGFRDGLIGCTPVIDKVKDMCTGQLIDRYGRESFTLKQVTIEDPNGHLIWHDDYDHEWGQWQRLLLPEVVDVDSDLTETDSEGGQSKESSHGRLNSHTKDASDYKIVPPHLDKPE
jgi:hypothetical protein